MKKGELLDGSYSVSDTQDYFQYIMKKHETLTDNLTVGICGNKIKNRITFKTKTRYFLKLLTPGTMKWLGNTKSKITRNGNGQNLPVFKNY